MDQIPIIDKTVFRRKVEALNNLPTLPNLLQKFTEMIRNPKTSMAEFGKELSKDQVLTSRILKLINSAFYGFPGRISTVTHALVLLGYDALRGLIVSSSIFEDLPPEAFQLWRHSIAVSLMSRAITREIGLPDVEEFAVAGLLHDIGKVILHIEAPEEYHFVIQEAENKKKSMWQVERELLGFDHAEIGQWLCEKWTLPEKLAIPIGYHHLPNLPDEYKIRAIVVSMADILVRGMGYGAENDLPLELPDPVLEAEVQLTLEQVRKLIIDNEPELEGLNNLNPKDMK